MNSRDDNLERFLGVLTGVVLLLAPMVVIVAVFDALFGDAPCAIC